MPVPIFVQRVLPQCLIPDFTVQPAITPILQAHHFCHVHQAQEGQLLGHVLHKLGEVAWRIIHNDCPVRPSACLRSGGMVMVRVVPMCATHVVLGNLNGVLGAVPRPHRLEDVVGVSFRGHMQAVHMKVCAVQVTDGVRVHEEAQLCVIEITSRVACTRAQVVLQQQLQSLPGLHTDCRSRNASIPATGHEGTSDPRRLQLHRAHREHHGTRQDGDIAELL
mmetsp:Transcript_43175/g.109491  ORF Transcript_43175/g.109491 Transcript_43175/m.109491 type:complete len:221 (+) Transcript_43175:1189-1851(+)